MTPILVALLVAQASLAQTAPDGALTASEADAAIAATMQEQRSTILLPKMTPVYISLTDPIGSKTNITGDHFAYTVARDVAIDGVVVIPAGTPGTGLVIHAKKAGGSGSSGELVLSPGELDLAGKPVRLRSLDMDAAGRDNMDLATAVGAAVGPFGFMVRGKNFDYDAGFVGMAKTAQDMEFPAPVMAAQSNEILQPEPANEGNIQ